MTYHRRRTDRIAIEVDVVLATVLTSAAATIIDISEGGAQIIGAVLTEGTRFMIEIGDDVVYAVVAWEEEDRMGVRFEHALKAGPLYELAQQAKVLAAMKKSNRNAKAVAAHPAIRMGSPVTGPTKPIFGRKIS